MIKDVSIAELNAHLDIFKSQFPPEQSALVLAGTGPNGAAHISTISGLTLDYVEQLHSVHVISGSVFSLMACLAHRQGALNRANFENYDREVRIIHQASIGKLLKHWVRKRNSPRTLFDNERIRETMEMLFGADFCAQPLQAFSPAYRFYAYCDNKQEIVELSVDTFPTMTIVEVAMATASVPFMHGQYRYQDMALSDPIFCPQIKQFRKRMFVLPGHKLYVNHKRSGLAGKVYFVKTEERRFPEFAMSCDFLSFNLGLSNRYVNNLHRRIIKEILADG
ncbi:MAG TPA: patatin-like phospholipase family protein [Marinagarivorans sp.]